MADILKRTNVENKDFDFTADDVNELIDAINLSYNNGGTAIKTSGKGNKFLADNGEYIEIKQQNGLTETYYINNIDFECLEDTEYKDKDYIEDYFNKNNGKLTNMTNMKYAGHYDSEHNRINFIKGEDYNFTNEEKKFYCEFPIKVKSENYIKNNMAEIINDNKYTPLSSITHLDIINDNNFIQVYDGDVFDITIKYKAEGNQKYGNSYEHLNIYFYFAELDILKTDKKYNIFYPSETNLNWDKKGEYYWRYDKYGNKWEDKADGTYTNPHIALDLPYTDGQYKILRARFTIGNNTQGLYYFKTNFSCSISLDYNVTEDSFDKYFLNVCVDSVSIKKTGRLPLNYTVQENTNSIKLLSDKMFDGYYTKDEVDNFIETLQKEKLGVDFSCTELPTENIKEKTVYFIPNGNSQEENIYTEYIYNNNQWEIIGSLSTDIDLSNYYTKDEVYTKTETYSQNEVDNKIEDKIDDLIVPTENMLEYTDLNSDDNYALGKKGDKVLISEYYKGNNSDVYISNNNIMVYCKDSSLSSFYIEITNIELYPNKEYIFSFEVPNLNTTVLNYFKMIETTYGREYNLTLLKPFSIGRNHIKFNTNNLYIKDNKCNIKIQIGYEGQLYSASYFYLSKLKIGEGNIINGYSKGKKDYSTIYGTLKYTNGNFSNSMNNKSNSLGNVWNTYSNGYYVKREDFNKTLILDTSCGKHDGKEGIHVSFVEGLRINTPIRFRLLKNLNVYFWLYNPDNNNSLYGTDNYDLVYTLENGKVGVEYEFIRYYNTYECNPIYKLHQDVYSDISTKNIQLYDSDTLDDTKLMFEIGKTTFNDSTTDIATMLHHKRDYASVIGYQQPEYSSYAYGSYIIFDKYNNLNRTYGDKYGVEVRQPTIFNENVKFLGKVEGITDVVPTDCYSKSETNNLLSKKADKCTKFTFLSTDFNSNELIITHNLETTDIDCIVINENNRRELCKITIVNSGSIKITNDRTFNGKLLIKKI